jgi:hypothetical protein
VNNLSRTSVCDDYDTASVCDEYMIQHSASTVSQSEKTSARLTPKSSCAGTISRSATIQASSA